MKVSEKTSDAFLSTEGGKTKSNAIETPSLSLPKGGGAIKAIDEKFSVNAVNGTASFAIPLPFSSPRGAAPNLSLSYNSGDGNGIFGLGWSLGLPSIKRKTQNELPQYHDAFDSDTFVFSQAEDLVPEYEKELDGSLKLDGSGDYVIREKDSPDGVFTIRFYKPRIEVLFYRIERWSSKTSGEIKWRVISTENVTTLFGWTTASRVSDPTDDNRIFEWLPEIVFDDKGNCTRYLYKKEDDAGFEPAHLHNKNRFASGDITYTSTYLSKVLYGNKTPYKAFGDPFPPAADFMFETVFDFGEYNTVAPFDEVVDWSFRQDAFSSYKAGFEIRTTRLCRGVFLIHHFAELPGGSAVVRSLDFEYESAPTFTFLTSATSRGYIKRADGTYTSKAMPPVEFAYQKPDWNKEVKTISSEAVVHSPAGISEQYQFTDLFSEGLAGILTEQAAGWYYKHNLGDGKFERAKLISPKPSFLGLDRLQLTDLDGDGSKQIVDYGSEPRGFFEIGDDDEWRPFKNFDTLPNIDLTNPNTRLIDLSGDGMADVLITEDQVFTWYRSKGRDGFYQARRIAKPLEEESGPRVVFAESRQTIFLADMNGDGMIDLVRIRNGEVCYWPNMGYGKFGTKVALDGAPVFDQQDVFNPALIRLADIDGSGTADIIYLGKDKVSCWMNQSGNGFSATPFEIDPFPNICNQSNITVVDLLGNGVACIVYSSDLEKDATAPLKYVDLMNGKKPHIMLGYKNNLGMEITLEYAPSTRFYIEDKLAGRPWVTKLHFPVHCVVKAETIDRISGFRFISSYKYHHGYFDHPEKEFRGFGLVEQTDAEHFEHWVKGTASNIVDESLHQAPVRTRSWFHTGAFLGRENILTQYAKDYWYEEMIRKGFAVVNNEAPLPDARIIAAPGLNPDVLNEFNSQEWREALRACKNLSLRSEVFALDAPLAGATSDQIKKELTPFAVTSNNCVIELVQPKGKNKHAVFMVKQSEALTYHYERFTEDPRISHTLNVSFDQYANVLESASVVYPRVAPPLDLPVETQQAQKRTFISYIQNSFTNDIDTDDDYRLRVLSEVKTYELKGVTHSGTLYSPADFENVLVASAPVEYHEVEVEPAPDTSQKRLIEHVRNIFYNDNLTGPLTLHNLSANGLAFENYTLAYTPALITDIYGTSKVDDAVMLEGKFTHSEGDNNWWVRSGTMQFIEGPETLSDAEDRFYLPISYTDPFGATAKVKYFSNYSLLIEEIEDALQNKYKVLTFNLRTLSPQRLQDANDNISEVLTDELGMVKALALFGKGAEADDLTGLDEFTSPVEAGKITNFFASAASDQVVTIGKDLLQHATMRFLYDPDSYKNSVGEQPAVAAAIVREQHFNVNPSSPVQLSLEYANGFGQVVLTKAQAEPGPAKQVTVNSDDTYTVSTVDTSASLPKQLRWIGNGRLVLNNKGNPVKQYEPYFSVTHRYEDLKELVETGVTPLLHYDPLGRPIRTDAPNETFTKTEFDSWMQRFYDQNDTVEESEWYIKRFNHLIDAELIADGKDPAKEKLAAEKAAKHFNTPLVQHCDTMGRPVLQIEHNKDALGTDQFYSTIVNADIEDNLRSVTDARGNPLIQHKYDMLGNLVYRDSADTGKRFLVNNILGKPLREWDERNHEYLFEYDILRRPISKTVKGGDGPSPLDHMYEKVIHGEGLPNDKLNNLRTRPVTTYDTAGKVSTSSFDFKGNPAGNVRSFARAFKQVANWNIASPDTLLEAETFVSSFEYDALNRVTRHTTPDNSIYQPAYNEAGRLDQVQITQNTTTEFFVRNIDYNEKGQRSRIVYGNDVTTRYSYDRETFKLIHLETKRQNNDPLQDVFYTFDGIGNITHIEDRNIPDIFFNNQKITGVSSLTYDALYRLTEATGREHVAHVIFGVNDNWNDQPFMVQHGQGDAMAWRNYTQQYEYDEVGNILKVQHSAGVESWTRNYTYAAGNNRLLSSSVGSDTYTYPHHPQHGFITALPHLTVMEWNFREELQATSRQSVSSGTPETTWYVYDGGGQRVRKITENQASTGVEPTRKSERIYVGGIEVYREYGAGGVVDLERKTLHVVDDKTRIAMIETRTHGIDDTLPRLVRYQFSNIIGSTNIETDQTARVIGYEEYHPYGTTSYQATDKDIKAAAKRYRYTGAERDEESGLEYHSARYYLPWLARWLNADPIGLNGGANFYAYSRNNPIMVHDPSGTDGETCGVWDEEATTCYAEPCPIASTPAEPSLPATLPPPPPRVRVRPRPRPAPPPPPSPEIPETITLFTPEEQSEPVTWESIRQTELAQGTGGLIAGTGSALVPGGFLIAPVGQATGALDRPTQTFQFWHSAGEFATGIAQIAVGAGGEVAGSALDVVGVAGAPETGGASLILTAAGVSLNVASWALIVQGATNVAAGAVGIYQAASMSSDPAGGASPPPGGGGGGGRPSVRRQAEQAGVREEIEGEFDVVVHGTESQVAQEMVDTQGGRLSASGGQHGGKLFTSASSDVAQVFAERAVNRAGAGSPGLVGIAIPRSVMQTLRNNGLVTTKEVIVNGVRIGTETIFSRGAIETLMRRGFFFRVQ